MQDVLFICNASSPGAAVEMLRSNVSLGFDRYSACLSSCGGGPCLGASAAVTPSEAQVAQQVAYTDYIDVMFSEALVDVASIDVDTPLSVWVSGLCSVVLSSSSSCCRTELPH